MDAAGPADKLAGMFNKSRLISRFEIETTERSQMIDVTGKVLEAVRKQDDLEDGQVLVFVPHTTAGVTIQENADPDVQHDLLAKLAALVPHKESYYRHAEGNSDSHLKAAMVGTSQQLIIEKGRPILGQWQGVYLCEFDGPRLRQLIVQVVPIKVRGNAD